MNAIVKGATAILEPSIASWMIKEPFSKAENAFLIFSVSFAYEFVLKTNFDTGR